MSEWDNILSGAGERFSIAYFNSDGTVEGECNGQRLAGDVDSSPADSPVLELTCGSKKDVFIKGQGNSLVSRTLNWNIPEPGKGGNFAAMKVFVDNETVLAEINERPAGNPPVLVRMVTDKETIIKSFESFDSYQRWIDGSGIPEDAIKERHVYSLTGNRTDRKEFEQRFESPASMREFLRAGESFIVGDSRYTSRESLMTALDALSRRSPDSISSVIILRKGSGTSIVRGKAKELLAFAQHLVQEASGKTFGRANVDLKDEIGDVRVELASPLGLRTRNTIIDSPVFQGTPYEGDFRRSAAGQPRSPYFGIGLSLSASWWFYNWGWGAIGLQLQEEFSSQFSSWTTADSKLFANKLSLNILPLRFDLGKGVHLELNWFNIGVYSLLGSGIGGNTLKDDAVKQDNTMHLPILDTGAALLVDLNKEGSVALSFGVGGRIPLPHDGQGVESGAYVKAGITIPLGKKREYKGTALEDAPFTPIGPSEAQLSMRIEEPPRKENFETAEIVVEPDPELNIDSGAFFKQGRYELLPPGKAAIDAWLRRISESDAARERAMLPVKRRYITIEGYTNSDGDEDSNLRLSINRAEAVKKYIAGQIAGRIKCPSISGNNIYFAGYGETELVMKDGVEDKEASRRVEVRVMNREAFLAAIERARAKDAEKFKARFNKAVEASPDNDPENLQQLVASLNRKSKKGEIAGLSSDGRTVNIIIDLTYPNGTAVAPSGGLKTARDLLRNEPSVKKLSRNVTYRLIVRTNEKGAAASDEIRELRISHLMNNFYAFSGPNAQPMLGGVVFEMAAPGSDILREYKDKDAPPESPEDGIKEVDVSDIISAGRPTRDNRYMVYYIPVDFEKDRLGRDSWNVIASICRKRKVPGTEVLVIFKGTDRDSATVIARFMQENMTERSKFVGYKAGKGAEDKAPGIYLVMGEKATELDQEGMNMVRDSMVTKKK